MSKLRKLARDRECQVRIPGICNHNPETTVLAHLGGAGMGIAHNGRDALAHGGGGVGHGSDDRALCAKGGLKRRDGRARRHGA